MNKAIQTTAIIAFGAMLAATSCVNTTLAESSKPNRMKEYANAVSAGATACYLTDFDGLDANKKMVKTISAGATTAVILDTDADSVEKAKALLSGGVEKEKTEAAAKVVTAKKDADTVYGYKNLGISLANKLNVRESASSSAKTIGQMDEGAGCEVLGYEEGWAKIESGSVSGYVLASYLTTGDAAKERAKNLATEVATVQTDALRVRSKASKDASVLARVDSGTQLPIADKDPNGEEGGTVAIGFVRTTKTTAPTQSEWIAVVLDEDTIGYVASEFVNVSKKLMTAKTISEVMYGRGVTEAGIGLCSYATQFVGNRYVWGGTSLTNGADCSGFVMSVYAKYGISLPHSSAAQSHFGSAVNASEAKPGDLFFYGGKRSINHVAIYIGNGMIVHASNPRDGIKVSGAFYRQPVCVRRLINN